MNDNLDKNIDLENLEDLDLEQINGGYEKDPGRSYMECEVLFTWPKIKDVRAGEYKENYMKELNKICKRLRGTKMFCKNCDFYKNYQMLEHRQGRY